MPTCPVPSSPGMGSPGASQAPPAGATRIYFASVVLVSGSPGKNPCRVSLLSFLLLLCCCGLYSQAPSSATLPRVGPASCKGNITAGSHLLNSSTCWLLCTDTQQPIRDWSQMVSCHPVSRPSPGMFKLPPPPLLMCFSTDTVCWLPSDLVSGLRQPTEKKGLPQIQPLQGKPPGQHSCFARISTMSITL